MLLLLVLPVSRLVLTTGPAAAGWVRESTQWRRHLLDQGPLWSPATQQWTTAPRPRGDTGVTIAVLLPVALLAGFAWRLAVQF